MGSGSSKLRKPPLMSGDELPQYPKRDKYWLSEPDSEKEIFYAKKGMASEAGFKAVTVPQLLTRAAEKHGDKPALCVERPVDELSQLPKVDGKLQIPPALPLDQWKTWTWNDYLRDSKRLAKAMMAAGFKLHDACNVFGFNSPEWAISQMASNFAGGRPAGIYPTDTPDQVQFKCDHSNGSVCIVDTQRNFDKVKQVVGKLPLMKAIVSWGPLKSYSKLKNGNGEDVLVMSWDDFMAFGDKITDAALNERTESIRAGHCSVIVYTSGTTGNPKAVMLCHDSLIFEAYAVIHSVENFGDKPTQERIVSYLPLSHVAGMMVDLIAPMVVTGYFPAWGTTYYARPYDLKAGSLVERLQAVKPTMFLGVPRVWEKMADKLKSVVGELTGVKAKLTNWAMNEGYKYTSDCNYGGTGHKSYSYLLADKLVLSKVRDKLGLTCCKYAFTGAAPIQVETQVYMGHFGININEVYGMSEGTGGTSWSNEGCHLWGSTGFPMICTDLRVYQGDPTDVNDKEQAPRAKNLFETKAEEEGEICSRGRNIMMGYMANPRYGQEHMDEIKKKNEESIDKDGYLHSADKGALDEAGFLKITGRFKELIIGAGGENIAPVPIEDNIKKICPIVSNIIMIGDKQKFNVALVTLKLEGATGEMPGTNKLQLDAFRYLGTSSKTINDAIDDEAIIKEVTDKIKETNKDGKVCISNACTIQKFMILPRDVSISTDELTATLKLKRGVVESKFQDMIKALYNSKEQYVKFPMDQFDKFWADYK